MNCDFCTHSKVCKYKEGEAKLAKTIDESIKVPYPYKVVVDCELQNNCMTVQGWNPSLTTTPCVKEQEVVDHESD